MFLSTKKVSTVGRGGSTISYSETYDDDDIFEIPTFRIGDKVEVLQFTSKKRRIFTNEAKRWKKAEIVNAKFGCKYDVLFENGTTAHDIKPYLIRPFEMRSCSNVSDSHPHDEAKTSDSTKKLDNKVAKNLLLSIAEKESWYLFTLLSDSKGGYRFAILSYLFFLHIFPFLSLAFDSP